MIEFNLLPDVKLEYIKARRLKRLVISLSVIIASSALGLFILLVLFVDVAQKVKLNNLNKSIAIASQQLKNTPNLNAILTIQNQLNALPSIEANTPQVSRLSGYLAEIMPANATLSSVTADFQGNTMTITGGADSLSTVNQLVDTLKFATYSDGKTSGTLAFSNVVLSEFGYGGAAAGSSNATYTINFSFDPNLFLPDENIVLTVPPEITTRSILGQPTVIFKAKG